LTATKAGKNCDALREKNLLKESLSSSHQTAIKALGALVEISGSICPMIDQLSNCPYYMPDLKISGRCTWIFIFTLTYK
jgi:hypothetical protein